MTIPGAGHYIPDMPNNVASAGKAARISIPGWRTIPWIVLLLALAACGGNRRAMEYAGISRPELARLFAEKYEGRLILARAVRNGEPVVHENRITAVAEYGFTYVHGDEETTSFWPFAARPVLEQPMLHPYYESFSLVCGDLVPDAPMPPASATCKGRPIRFASRSGADEMLALLSALHKTYEPDAAEPAAPEPPRKRKARLK